VAIAERPVQRTSSARHAYNSHSTTCILMLTITARANEDSKGMAGGAKDYS
jgi:hypothetical protein